MSVKQVASTREINAIAFEGCFTPFKMLEKSVKNPAAKTEYAFFKPSAEYAKKITSRKHPLIRKG